MNSMMNLPLGIYEKALPYDLTWASRLEAAKRAQFDYVELSIDESDERLARLDQANAERVDIRNASIVTGVPLKTMCLSAHRKYPFGSASVETRQQALDILDKAVDLACELGIRVIQLAGYYVYYEDETEASLGHYQDGLAKGLELAAKAGVMLAIENMDTVGVASLEEGMKLVSHFNSPWLQLYPDLGNLIEREKDILPELERAKGHMVALHVKDTRPGEPRRVPFGEGGVPFEAAFTKLYELGFNGPVMIEMWNDNAADSLERVVKTRAWVVDKMLRSGLLKHHNMPINSAKSV
ncbi:MAG: L-ribulose-5-phosphate 3-epimerase [Deinococcota bacterium]